MKTKQLIIILLLLINESFLYLFDSRNLTMLVSIIALVWGIANYNRILKLKYYFKTLIIIYLLINVISVFYANIKYGQPIIVGFKGIHWIFIFLLYFYFRDSWRNIDKELVVNKIMDTIAWFSVIVSIICIVQIILYPNIHFLNISIGERYGSYRFFSLLSSVIFGYGITLSMILKKYQHKYMAFLIIQMVAVFYVGKTRSLILYIIISTIVMCVLSQRKLTVKKLLIVTFGIPISVIGYLILSKTNIYQNYFVSVFSEVDSENGTIGNRLLGADYYLSLFKENVLLGVGRIVSEFDKTAGILGEQYSYYLSDLYYWGFILNLGIFGAVWLLFYLFKMLKLFVLYKDEIILRGMLLFKIVPLITLFLINDIDTKEYVLYTVIFMAMVDPYVSRYNKKIRQN